MDEADGGHRSVSVEGPVWLFIACVMNAYSSVGHDTKLCDAGNDAASDDALPCVLCTCYLCSVVFRPSGREKVFLAKCFHTFLSQLENWICTHEILKIACLIGM